MNKGVSKPSSLLIIIVSWTDDVCPAEFYNDKFLNRGYQDLNLQYEWLTLAVKVYVWFSVNWKSSLAWNEALNTLFDVFVDDTSKWSGSMENVISVLEKLISSAITVSPLFKVKSEYFVIGIGTVNSYSGFENVGA